QPSDADAYQRVSSFASVTSTPPQSPTLFPYTTLFRSRCLEIRPRPIPKNPTRHRPKQQARGCRQASAHRMQRLFEKTDLLARPRSEEHTSELQSRENLVCRLLLEKKKR